LVRDWIKFQAFSKLPAYLIDSHGLSRYKRTKRSA